MPHGERCLNVAFGISAISWAVLGLIEGFDNPPLGVVRYSVAAINLVVGALFIVRAPVAINGSPAQIFASLPSLLVAGWAIASSRPLHDWPSYAELLFAAGTGLAIISFFTLGRSFAILPALRDDIATRGPFRFIRHPAYAGELIMVAACGIAVWRWAAVLPVLLAPPLVVLRILAEERVLLRSPAYAGYAKRTRWRLIPGVW